MCFRLFARLRIRHSHALLERHSFMGTACASSKTRERTIRSGLRPYALPGSAFFLKATSFVRMKWHQFAGLLATKAREGVAVRLLYDWMGSRRGAGRSFWRNLSES